MKKKFFTIMLVFIMILSIVIATVGCEITEKDPPPSGDRPPSGESKPPVDGQEPDDNDPDGSEPGGDKDPDGNEPDDGDGSGDGDSSDEKIEDGDTDYSTIYTFENGTITGLTDHGKTLSELIVPSKIGGEAVTAVGKDAFKACYNVTSVKFADTDSKVSIIGYAFNDCENLKTVVLSAGVNLIQSYSFYFCTNVETVRVNSANTKYKSDGNCIIDKETNAVVFGSISAKIPQYVTSIGKSAFAGIWKLKNIEIPDSVEAIEPYAFYLCSALESVAIPSKTASIGRYAFYGCKNIHTLTFGDAAALKSIEDCAFYNCKALKRLDVPASVETLLASSFGNCSALESIIFDDASALTKLGEFSFQGCSALKKVVLPDTLTDLGGKAIFNGCKRLEEINLPANLEKIGYSVFENCLPLTKLSIPSTCTVIGGQAFKGCTALTLYCEAASKPSGFNVNWNQGYSPAPGTDIGMTRIPVVWDSKNNDLDEKGYAHHYDEKGVHYTVKDGAATVARQKRTIEELDVPSSITYKGTAYSVTAVANDACYSSTLLKRANLPASIEKVGKSVFNGCSTLESVTFENNIKFTVLESNFFKGCEKLNAITIPLSVTDIGSYAFSGCASLTDIVIRDTVSYVGSSAFAGCTSLTSIKCGAAEKPVKWSSSWNEDGIDVIWNYKTA